MSEDRFSLLEPPEPNSDQDRRGPVFESKARGGVVLVARQRRATPESKTGTGEPGQNLGREVLDAMLSDHAEGVTADSAELAQAEPEESEPEARSLRELDTPVETVARAWAADPNANICGLRKGGIFELHNGGPEIDGAWVVTQLILPLEAAPEARMLVATRAEGGPPYLRINEPDFTEELAIGNAVIVQIDARG